MAEQRSLKSFIYVTSAIIFALFPAWAGARYYDQGGYGNSFYNEAPRNSSQVFIPTITASNVSLSEEGSDTVRLSFSYGSEIQYFSLYEDPASFSVTKVSATSSVVWPKPKNGLLYVKFCTMFNYCSEPAILAVASSPSASSPTPPVISTSTDSLSGNVPHPPSSSGSIVLARSLSVGSEGDDVSFLQTLLKKWGYYTYDKITGYFGPKTKEAVIAFQTANGLAPVGNVGPLTRAKVASLSGDSAPSGTPSTPRAQGPFMRNLSVGSSGEDVRSLQTYLNAHGFLVAEAGAGSPGNETTLFGRATQAALAKFQKAKGIVPAEGYFGQKTRSYISAE